MDTTRPTLHPALMVAAVSVTALSLAGVGVLTGVLPFGQKSTEPVSQIQTAATQPALVAPSAALPIAAPPTVSVNISNTPTPAPVAKAATPKPVRVARKSESANGNIDVIRAERQPEQVRASLPLPPAPNQAPPVCRDCGTIESVHEIAKEVTGSGVGAVAGGVLGGVLGNQVGNGRGRDLATIVGAIGGAVAGNQVEKSQRRVVQYEVTVRFEDGTSRVFTQDTPPAWRSGDRVKVENGLLMGRA